MKTDLFDEAVGEGLLRNNGEENSVFGLDISWEVASAAKRGTVQLRPSVADLRRLPIADESIDRVISNSSLDHFDTETDLLAALGEIHRVTRQGGELFLSLDNPHCLLVALRSVIPHAWLQRIGILRYPVGATLSARRLRGELVRCGFIVEHQEFLMHVPRVIAIPLSSRFDRSSASRRKRFVKFLLRFEWLERLPTREFTGHFVAVVAKKV